MCALWNDDPFSKKAKRENFLARSVYKLEEIDKKEHLLRNAKIVIDLGAAPGSWIQYCLRHSPHVKIIAVDPSPIKISDPRVTILQSNVEDTSWSNVLHGKKADLLLSDMAPKTSGIHQTDVARSLELANCALQVAKQTLNKGGTMVLKVFMGPKFELLFTKACSLFNSVKRLRPLTTRKHSREIYLICKQFA